MVVGALTTVLSTIGGSFWQYALWRTVNAVAVQGMSTAAIVWATEPVRGSRFSPACVARSLSGFREG